MKMPDVLNRFIEKLQNPPIFLAPERTKMKMTPARYARKTAFHIDPLLAETVEVENEHHPRCEEERYGDDLWKQRVQGTHGHRAWKPMLTIILLIIATVVVRSGDPSFAAPAASKTTITDPHVQITMRALDKLHRMGYTWTTNAGADRAIRHWQKVNGLVVDGIVGTQTGESLGITLGDPVVPANVSSKPRRGNPTPPPVDPATNEDTPATPPLPVIPATDPATTTRGADQWHDLAMAVGWTENEWPVLSCIINRESNGLPGVKNKHSSATGLLQILASYYKGVDLRDPQTNLTIGLQLFQSRGWQPWTLPGHQCY